MLAISIFNYGRCGIFRPNVIRHLIDYSIVYIRLLYALGNKKKFIWVMLLQYLLYCTLLVCNQTHNVSEVCLHFTHSDHWTLYFSQLTNKGTHSSVTGSPFTPQQPCKSYGRGTILLCSLFSLPYLCQCLATERLNWEVLPKLDIFTF